MPRLLASFCWLIASSVIASAQSVVPLWTGPAPDSHGTAPKDIPTLAVYLPPSPKGPAPAVVICPGGAYAKLAMTHEGTNVAQWFQKHGVAAFVLQYRLPTDGYLHPVPLHDAQRAMRLVRSHATDWKIDPARVAVMGFSAGGHLASTLETHYDAGDAKASDPVDRLGCRPDIAILVYPVITLIDDKLTHRGSRANLLGPAPDPALINNLSNETQVTAKTPPTVLVVALDDHAVPPVNSRMMYDALRKAGVPSALQEYPKGGHGFGYKPKGGHAPPGWLEKVGDWLKAQGFMP